MNCPDRRFSVQVYALIAIACMKLGRAIDLHSSRSEVRALPSMSRRFATDVQMSLIRIVNAVHFSFMLLMHVHDVA